MAIIRRAFSITIKSMGTTAVALGGGVIAVLVGPIVRLHRDGWEKGWPVVKASLVGDAGIGFLVACTVWLVVFLVSLGRAIEEQRANASAVVTGLTPAQKDAVRGVARKYPRPSGYGVDAQYRYFIIFPIPGDSAAVKLALDLRNVLGGCGFNPQLVTSGELPGVDDLSPFTNGIWLRGTGAVDMGEYNPTTVDVVSMMLEAASIQFHRSPDDVGDVELIIGSPPPSPTDEAVQSVVLAEVREQNEQLRREVLELKAQTHKIRRLDNTQRDAFVVTARLGREELEIPRMLFE